MQLFYAPDITIPSYTLSEEESKHCVRVLRLGAGDMLRLTDGRGSLYIAEVTDPNPRRCTVTVRQTIESYEKRSYELVIAVAPTKNSDRFEWFLEKATEVGIDRIIPLECDRSERRTINMARSEKVVVSAVKQSLKAYMPQFDPMTRFRETVTMPFDGDKLIAHCDRARGERRFVGDEIKKNGKTLILIGPEGDFSPEEITFAVENGFREISLGASRLRTETAALTAAVMVSFINQ